MTRGKLILNIYYYAEAINNINFKEDKMSRNNKSYLEIRYDINLKTIKNKGKVYFKAEDYKDMCDFYYKLLDKIISKINDKDYKEYSNISTSKASYLLPIFFPYREIESPYGNVKLASNPVFLIEYTDDIKTVINKEYYNVLIDNILRENVHEEVKTTED